MAEVRGVLDSSLLATALVSPHGPGNALLDAARLHRFQLAVSPAILDEVHRTLVGDFDVSAGDADDLIALLARMAEVQQPAATVAAQTRDPSDDHVLALAEESGSLFLATYDHDLMAVGSTGPCGVVHPVTALQLVRSLTVESEDEPPGVAPGPA